MKSKFVFIASAILSISLLAACGTDTTDASQPPVEPTDEQELVEPSVEPTADESTVPDAGEENATAANLAECLKLLGMDDAAAKDMLGGGTENMAADGETMIGRIYSVELFGEQTEPSTMYNEDKVAGVSIYLAGEDSAPYSEQLKAIYGEPDETSDGASSESGSTWECWNTEDGQIKLIQSYGLCSLELTAIAG